MQRRELPEGWDADLPVFAADAKGLASRNSSGKVLNAIALALSLAHRRLGRSRAVDQDPAHIRGRRRSGGRHARRPQSAFRDSRACHGSDPERAGVVQDSPLRLGLPDLLRLHETADPTERADGAAGHLCLHARLDRRGQDGPTHQPVEQLIALRSIPGLITLRPADANEVVEAWRVIIGLQHQPACLVLSRQPLPTFDRKRYAPAAGLARGAYVLADAADGKPEVILIGTGSEVALCIDAYEQLKREGIPARVVSMPSWELFEQQDQSYRDGVLPPDITARVSVEMGSVIGWDRYAGPTGAKIGMTHIWLLGAAQGSAHEVRLHAGKGRLQPRRSKSRRSKGTK